MTGTATGNVDLYLQTARVPNAYAAGRHSVAVTSRVVQDHVTGRLPEGQLVAMLVHELGHHATGTPRPLLLLSWLTAPAAVLGPLADAAIRRRAEYAADFFAADHCLARPLANALRILDGDRDAGRSLPRRLFDTHPAVDSRITALLARSGVCGSSAPAALPTVGTAPGAVTATSNPAGR